MNRALIAALCLAAVPALAFEGVIETRMTASGKMAQTPGAQGITGTGTISIKGLNTRLEHQVNMPGVTGPMKQVVIHRGDEPGVTYMLNENQKTYHKVVADKDEAKEDTASKWTVKRLGKDTVAGRSTEHVQVTRVGGNEPMDVWIDRNLVSAGDLEKAISQNDRDGGWWSALKKEGVAGIPLKVVANRPEGGGMTWEATSVKSTSVPDSAFKIPAGYTESKTGGGMMNSEQRQQMRDQMMQRLTPEQREKIQEMMKQHGGGGQ